MKSAVIPPVITAINKISCHSIFCAFSVAPFYKMKSNCMYFFKTALISVIIISFHVSIYAFVMF